jgi:aminopeptidase N
VVVHELAHQWYGDSLSVAQWQHIWLNEGFATYAEWLWSEDTRGVPAQDTFDFYYSVIPEDDPFWQTIIGDPGPDLLFDFAVYARGAMTLHQLRLAVGDDDFFKILRRWAQKNEGGNVTTDEFIALAERISGQQLDELFETWLFTPGKPELPGAMAARSSAAALSVVGGASVSGTLWRHHPRS